VPNPCPPGARVTKRALREDQGVTLAEAYRRYAPDLYRFALRLCGERTAAEDLAAEAFALAVGGAAPPPGASVRGSLLGTVRNLNLHRRHSAARRPVAPLGPDRHAEGGPGPERDAAARAELQATLRDLQALPEEARAASSSTAAASPSCCCATRRSWRWPRWAVQRPPGGPSAGRGGGWRGGADRSRTGGGVRASVGGWSLAFGSFHCSSSP